MSPSLFIASLLVGCGPAEDTDGPGVITAPPLPPEVPDPWVREGQVGDLTLIRQEESLSVGRQLRSAAVFADRLDSLRWPAACELADRLCVPADAALETEIDSTDVRIDADAAFAWLGDELALGDLVATFRVDDETGVAGYRGRIAGTGLLEPRYPLAFDGGEWGDFAADDVVELPDRVTVLAPPVDRPIELDGGHLTRFRWVPTGVGQMVLSVSGPSGTTVRLLEDDGDAWLDTAGVRFSEPLDVRLSRVVDAGTVEIAGNSLALHTIAEQGWCLYDTCDDQPIGGVTTELAFEFCWSTTSCGDSRWILQPNGTWTTDEGYVGTWDYDCCSRRIDIVFSSGTVYSGEVADDGCIEGEMVSWSGNQGDWRGCL
ncbi:MAG: hypothetical protein R3F61_17615 [Myxococcota bacterium]